MKTTKLIAAICLFFAVAACNKPGTDGQSFHASENDRCAGPFTQVNVEIRDVEVHTQDHGWVSLPTNAGGTIF